jgi:hypothetical protein
MCKLKTLRLRMSVSIEVCYYVMYMFATYYNPYTYTKEYKLIYKKQDPLRHVFYCNNMFVAVCWGYRVQFNNFSGKVHYARGCSAS